MGRVGVLSSNLHAIARAEAARWGPQPQETKGREDQPLPFPISHQKLARCPAPLH